MIKCGYKINNKCDFETLDDDFEIVGTVTDECIGEESCQYYEKWLNKEIEKNNNKLEKTLTENERLKAELIRKEGSENEDCNSWAYYNLGDGCEFNICIHDEEEYKKNTENTFKPNYYKAGSQDVIAFCQYHDIPFDLGTVIKYCTRAGKKKDNSELQDLNKALEFLNRRIEFVKTKGE